MKKILVLLFGIILVLGGLFCLFNPSATFLLTGYVVGAFILCDGIANIIAWFDAKKYANISGWYLFEAITSLLFGIIVMLNVKMQFLVDMAIVYIICTWIIIAAIFKISLAIKIKKVNSILSSIFKNKKWISLLLIGILMIVFAVICMIQPAIMSILLGALISLVIIFNGISLITLSSYIL